MAGLAPVVFQSTHQPTFQDMDPYGHPNTNRYLSYFLEHRFIGMRESAALAFKAIDALPIGFYNRKIELEFLRPVFADDVIHIRSWVASHDESTCLVLCEMKNAQGKLLAKCQMDCTCVDKKSGRPTRWPAGFLERFFIPT